MNTHQTGHRWITQASLTALFFLMALMSGCQVKCPIPVERQTSVSATPWRLVETNDPEFQQYRNPETGQFTFTFLVFNFSQTFTGDVKLVQNNTQYDQPARTFVYDINPRTRQMMIKFAFPGGEDGQTGSNQNSGNGGQQGATPIVYSYRLSNTLEMVSQKGQSYRFVPFTGVLAPDDSCVF